MKTHVVILFAFCACCRADVVSDIRHALDHVTCELDRKRNVVGQFFEYGIGCSTNGSYRMLSAAVSNEWESVLGNLSSCATNQIERLLVLGVRDQFGEDFYLDYLDGVFNLWLRGEVTNEEMEWTRHSDRPGFAYLFARRYAEDRVRRLVLKFQQAEPNRTLWQKVLSGEAYTNYLDRVAAGAL